MFVFVFVFVFVFMFVFLFVCVFFLSWICETPPSTRRVAKPDPYDALSLAGVFWWDGQHTTVSQIRLKGQFTTKSKPLVRQLLEIIRTSGCKQFRVRTISFHSWSCVTDGRSLDVYLKLCLELVVLCKSPLIICRFS